MLSGDQARTRPHQRTEMWCQSKLKGNNALWIVSASMGAGETIFL
jgi:hypothetical protein